jgi:serralysin
LVSTQDISVTVNAVNDNTPIITSTGTLSILENSAAVTSVTATDADLPTQSLAYSISGGSDSMLFSINLSTGELTFIAAPDYEMQKDAGLDNIYNVTVQASDGAFASTQDISVTVTPVNDNIPIITSPAGLSIYENTTAITTITATDSDLPAQTLIYSIIGGADSPLFTINSSTGSLAFVASHDYEIPNDVGVDNIYNVTVQASDGTLNATQNIAIGILPVNDNSPAITSLNSFSIPENTSVIATLTAIDADRPSQPLTYSIISGLDALKFSIVSASGELKFITVPDFEVPTDFNLDNIYEVVVQVSDGIHNSTQHIVTRVTNAD